MLNYQRVSHTQKKKKRISGLFMFIHHLLSAAMQQHFQLLVACQLSWFPFRKWADVAMSVAYTQHRPIFAPEPTMVSTKLLWLNAENMFEWWFHDVWWSWVKQWNPSSCDIKVFMGETSQSKPPCLYYPIILLSKYSYYGFLWSPINPVVFCVPSCKHTNRCGKAVMNVDHFANKGRIWAVFPVNPNLFPLNIPMILPNIDGFSMSIIFPCFFVHNNWS